MDSSEETANCSHCNKKVAKSNLPMHEAHCKRFLCLCPDCDEQMPMDQLEEHRQEEHTLIKCKKCNMKMERCKLPDHEANECTERLQNCKFCQLTLPSNSLKEHVVACGCRTERCQDCTQYVMLKDQLQHAQFCTADDFKHLQKKKKLFGKMSYTDEDQISTCLYCHLTLPVKMLKWHETRSDRTGSRIGHSRHAFLFNNEESPTCDLCKTRLIIKHAEKCRISKALNKQGDDASGKK